VAINTEMLTACAACGY